MTKNATDTNSTSIKTGYAAVNGLNMYYEVHGEGSPGTPLVLIHGGLSAMGTSFGAVLPSLAMTRRIVAVELQAHALQQITGIALR